MAADFCVSEIDETRSIATHVRKVLSSRTVEYGVLAVLAVTVAYAAFYAMGTHDDVQSSLRTIDTVLRLL
ncbi:MAG: hypothetical protein GY842_24140 [bacterium]|nr:hypothetical protein [bacterium]